MNYFGVLVLVSSLAVLCHGYFDPISPAPASNKTCNGLCGLARDKVSFDVALYSKFVSYLQNDNTSWNQISTAINDQLSWEVMRNLWEDNRNIAYSPVGAAALLGMVLLGAGGKTRLEVENMLNLYNGNWDSSAIQRAISNYEKAAIAGKYGFYCAHLEYIADKFQLTTNAAYKAYVTSVMNANLTFANFARDQVTIQKSINNYIATKTNQSYKGALKSVLDTTESICLLNALYFRGRWEQAFDTKLTFDGKFKDSMNKESVVKMMSSVGSFFNYRRIESKFLEVLEMPYYGNISLFIFLPYADSTLTKDFFVSGKTYLEAAMKTVQQMQVDVQMPKMRLQVETNFQSPFQKMGIEGMFVENAELIGISKGAYISESKQMVFIEINEGLISENIKKGTPPSGLPKKQFYVNRPFAFVIKDKKSDCNLFMGIVNEVTTQ